jgi:hypothetical protein
LFVKEFTLAYCLHQDCWNRADGKWDQNRSTGGPRKVRGGSVGVSEILAEIDREIAQLQQARALLSGSGAAKSKGPVSIKRRAAGRKKKRNLTPEGRKRIAEAVKRRWAEQKKRAAANK